MLEVVREGVRYRVEEGAVRAHFAGDAERIVGLDGMAKLYVELAQVRDVDGVYVIGRV